MCELLLLGRSLLKSENNVTVNETGNYFPQPSNSVVRMKLNRKEREINDKNRSSGGVVSIYDGSMQSPRLIASESKPAALPKKGRPAKKKEIVSQENKPLNDAYHHHTNDVSEAADHFGTQESRIVRPLQEIPSYRRADNLNGLAPNPQLKQEENVET